MPGQSDQVDEVNAEIADYFSKLELPDEPNLFDVITLSLRGKDAIFTFNWDPFLLQSRIRLAARGAQGFPSLFFLHGNVRAGYCRNDARSGLAGRPCSVCGEPFEESPLLFPVERKNYQDGQLIEREWKALDHYLRNCFMLTVFGYSAPKTDVEAVGMLSEAWGTPAERPLEQTEIVIRPGADQEAIRGTWAPFIHSHHYEIHESFYESWQARHPRRTGEAHANQYLHAKFIDNNRIPTDFEDLKDLIDWFEPLMAGE
jgi:hypothetical protein